MQKLDIHEIAYHRNGISGEPFYVVSFRDPVFGEMIGVLFDFDPERPEPKRFYNPRTAVFQREQLERGEIAFGANSFRGDHYNRPLREAIRAYERELAPR